MIFYCSDIEVLFENSSLFHTHFPLCLCVLFDLIIRAMRLWFYQFYRMAMHIFLKRYKKFTPLGKLQMCFNSNWNWIYDRSERGERNFYYNCNISRMLRHTKYSNDIELFFHVVNMKSLQFIFHFQSKWHLRNKSRLNATRKKS